MPNPGRSRSQNTVSLSSAERRSIMRLGGVRYCGSATSWTSWDGKRTGRAKEKERTITVLKASELTPEDEAAMHDLER